MTAGSANLMNAIVLVAFSAWGYLVADKASWTALIPAAAGVVLLFCQPGILKENKVIAHIAVTVTLVIGLVLLVPFIRGVSGGDFGAILRVGTMIFTSILAMVYFIKSFIDARRAREG
ncbi:MAG: hypothetical protein AAF871_08620 [Pseudomonadota bacterium]